MATPVILTCKAHGPTTVLQDGQRYLDLPSMPLIPTYVAGRRRRAGAVPRRPEEPGPHARRGHARLQRDGPAAARPQRPGMTGSGYTDLLGYRPRRQLPARRAAAADDRPDRRARCWQPRTSRPGRTSSPRASASAPTRRVSQGATSRTTRHPRSVVASIVQQDGIVVSISSNDGTRLYTRAAVGPDGGSTPTDTAPRRRRGHVHRRRRAVHHAHEGPRLAARSPPAAPPWTTRSPPRPASRTGGTVAETRISGFGTFSSGFGSRVDLSAPSDNIIAFEPVATLFTPAGHRAGRRRRALNGGTSASAPEIAAAAAVVLQAVAAGRTPPDAPAGPGPAEAHRPRGSHPAADRPDAARRPADRRHRRDRGGPGRQAAARAAPPPSSGSPSRTGSRSADLGGTFLETTDQNRIDLGDVASGGNGEGLVGPVTFAGDVTGAAEAAARAAVHAHRRHHDVHVRTSRRSG